MSRVAILGTGGIGLGTAALLAQAGHTPVLWSPTSTRRPGEGEVFEATGKIPGSFQADVASDCDNAIRMAEAVVIAVPGYAQRSVLDACAASINSDQLVIISSHCSFGALYLSQRAAARDAYPAIVALGTTLITARSPSRSSVAVSAVREKVDAATVPGARREHAMQICRSLFGDRFVERSDLLAIALSNLNPQNHMAMALANFTRIERGEAWGNYEGITPSVGRLIEALDAERLALAEHLGVSVRSVREHFHRSFDVPLGPVAEMAALIHGRGNAPMGPTSTDTRYVLEDVPFGLVVTEAIGRAADRPMPLHTAGIDIYSALYERDFRAENDLLPELGDVVTDLPRLVAACRHGWEHSADADG